MAINFFEPECATTTSEKVFGICDKPPATLEFNKPDSWIAEVVNEDQKEITFTAIDVCLDIPPEEGGRCDAMIRYEKTVIFIELKDRDGGDQRFSV